MSSDENPLKADIASVFKRLRSQPANKCCFDCGANNPTWSSVTYGVFICIDCSAVHRGLGVHLSFVRSTQLDTNWTWLQLRAMQLGGNGNAAQFFRQHGCSTADSQQKYKSRAAQLYRDKLHQSAVQCMRLHGTKLNIDAGPVSPVPSTKEAPDFFAEHTDDAMMMATTVRPNQSFTDDAFIQERAKSDAAEEDNEDRREPNVDHLHTDASDASAKPALFAIGKKAPPKKLGAKKLGGQKVGEKINFEEIAARAENAEKMPTSASFMDQSATIVDPDVTQVSQRLMMQSIDDDRRKQEERLTKLDPKKAAQAERLGIGMGSTGGSRMAAAHSLKIVDVQQDGVRSSNSNKQSNRSQFEDYGDIPRVASSDKFYDARDSNDWTIVTDREPTSKNGRSLYDDVPKNNGNKSSSKNNDFFDSWAQDEPPSRNSSSRPSKPTPVTHASAPSSEEASKRFGGQKAISSDQFFSRNRDNDFETRTNLSRFEGSSGISSADYYGGGPGQGASATYSAGYGSQMPDVQDIKDSVRTGVTKVAGKLSNLSSSLSSYVQDNYG